MSLVNTFPQSEEEKALWYRSEMNNRQFKALAYRLKNADIENEILNNRYFLKKISLSAKYSEQEVAQWLNNSWNTETVLALNRNIIGDTNQSFCMQWAFPQAYYAVYGNILAMFKAIGITETSHTAVLKKYASMMTKSQLPESIGVCCSGTKNDFEFYNIDLPSIASTSMKLDLFNHDTINNHICRFLRATRELRLEDKKQDFKFRTKSGKYRTNFNKEHWQKVSDSLGPTTILDFLYRKRIKSNYQDIETYNCPYFNGKSVLKSLVKIIDRINLVNETYTAKVLGFKCFDKLASKHLLKVENSKLDLRIKTIEQILASL